MINLQDYTYDLSPERIALYPCKDRTQARLLIYQNQHIKENTFARIGTYLQPGDQLILNDTAVMAARLHFPAPFSEKGVEIFCLAPQSAEACVRLRNPDLNQMRLPCLVRGAKKIKQPLTRTFGTQDTLTLYLECPSGNGMYEVLFNWTGKYCFADVLEICGTLPLPPYIRRPVETQDRQAYQSVYAQHTGSVAAPTAGLHFSRALLNALHRQNICTAALTLHISADTFKPVQVTNLRAHPMHGEWFSVSKQTLSQLIRAQRRIAVGTTSLRTLESLYCLGLKKYLYPHSSPAHLEQWEAYDWTKRLTYKEALEVLLNHMDREHLEVFTARTHLLISPGYTITSVKGLITNFHQPHSTLLLLVAAFVGPEWRRIYDYARNKDFKFLSYGDASLLFAPS